MTEVRTGLFRVEPDVGTRLDDMERILQELPDRAPTRITVNPAASGLGLAGGQAQPDANINVPQQSTEGGTGGDPFLDNLDKLLKTLGPLPGTQGGQGSQGIQGGNPAIPAQDGNLAPQPDPRDDYFPNPQPGTPRPSDSLPTPDTAPGPGEEQVGAVHNYLRAFYDQLAWGLALPSDAVNGIIGAMGVGILPKDHSFHAQNKEALNALGIKNNPVPGLSEKLGRETFNSSVQALAMVLAAPHIATQKGTTAWQYIKHNLMDAIRKNPTLATASTIGGGLGARTAGHVTEGKQLPYGLGSAEPYAELLGGMAGGITGEAALNTGKKVLSLPIKAGQKIGQTVGLLPKPTTPQPLYPQGLEDLKNTTLHSFAESQLKNDQDIVNTAIAQALQGVPRTGTSDQIQQRVRAGLDRAERIFRRVEGEFWQRVDQTRPVLATDLRRGVDRMVAELRDSPSVRPDEFIERIIHLTNPVRQENGQYRAQTPSIRRWRDLSGEIARAAKSEAAASVRGQSPNDGLIRNYSRLQRMINDQIDSAYPNDTALAQAKAFSTKYHDVFDRGGLADVLAQRARGDDRVPAGQTIEALMKKYQGLNELLELRNKIAYTRQPGRNAFAITSPERREVQALIGESENAIRAMFREAADAKGPEGAAKWFAQHEKYIKPFARLSAELESTSQNIVAYQKRLEEMQKSALAKFVKEGDSDPQNAIKRIWSDRSGAVGRNDEILKTIRRDPDALQAYRHGLLIELFQRTKMDPVRMRDALQDTTVKRIFNEAFVGKEESLTRLREVVQAGVAGSGKTIGKFISPSSLVGGSVGAGGGTFFDAIAPGAGTAGAIGGAMMGRHMARLMGSGGTVQIPGIMASRGRNTVEKIFAIDPIEQQLARAFLDPKYEAVLKSRMGTPADVRALEKRMRNYLAGISGAREAAVNALDGDDNE